MDRPTESAAYTMKQIGSNAIAESFMKRVTLTDGPPGNARRWDPDGVKTTFLGIPDDVDKIEDGILMEFNNSLQ
jgi:hypothetical protein